MNVVHWKTLYGVLVVGSLLIGPSLSYGQGEKKLEWISAGVRGGINLDPGGIPPGEKEDFQLFDTYAILGFPGSWEWPSGWEARYTWRFTAGILRGAGDEGFIGTTGPAIILTNWDWRVSLDLGTGAAFVSDEKFGRQDFGGPVQIIGHGGVSYHFPGHITLGWRFHHFSDAAIYGTDNRGIDFHIIELGYRF
ncbi:MAG: acyloxyacyl hydrolase [Nitrospirales bacterium]|nr:acyloxyacyl hydrolase [Nitrospira sp.]MCA9479052.1 acyloxyacyl hydrolase [Nitrospira sp.]MCB9711705.1 acyloxyacyl hydrolase [Nitrospiraceae bacterium]MDR4487606.1 acyloxyacyl hydrolase [Nitrospirales bacterium]